MIRVAENVFRFLSQNFAHLFLKRLPLVEVFDGFRIEESSSTDDDWLLLGRVFPKLFLETRFPLVRYSKGLKQIIEPVLLGTLSPNGSNSTKIIDEEGTVFELDDTNLLSSDRFSGLDRVDSGSRIVYGLKSSIYGGIIGSINKVSENRELQVEISDINVHFLTWW